MKIFDEQGLRTALEQLEKTDSTSTGKRKVLSYGKHRFWLVCSVLVASACSLVHVATLVAEPERLRPAMFALALLTLVLFAKMLVSSGFGRKSREMAMRGDLLGGLESSLEEMVAVVKKVPTIVIAGILLMGAYCSINFYTFVRLSIEGSPVERDGGYWLEDHGRVVRSLKVSEFRHRETWELRGMSGHLVGFAVVAAIGFAYVVEHRPKDAS
jgi:hypothetical protein